ncbi:MAG: hypothetical protein JW812_00620 [Alphaproteobacteria bacterium]|nr:hypothetical protein [Alphaproteobacteria bacterium]MBN2779524.1 hypothetical protein [Alphaproteobacteria bacterium]
MIPKNAHRFDPFDLKDLVQINAALKHNRLSEIPADYVSFLSKTNGLIFRDLELYGVLPHIIKERFFSFPDIVSYNKRYADHPFLIHKLIVGQDSQSFLVYDAPKKVYLLCDRISFQPTQVFQRFEEFIKIIMID